MSEKNTDRYMQNVYEEVFNHEYHTEANNELFNSLIPDGWDIIDNILIIIENKRLIKHKEEGKTQLFNYYDNLSDDIKSKYVTYLILGLGNNKKSFNIFSLILRHIKTEAINNVFCDFERVIELS